MREVRSTGTVNAVYRLGDDVYARLPRLREWAPDLERECRWLPVLAPSLTLRVPEPVAVGRPAAGYPLPWAVFRWIDGEPYADGLVDDEADAAEQLAGFVTELRAAAPVDGAPRGGRRPLADLDAATREALAATGGALDRAGSDGPGSLSAAAHAAWERALDAPPWDGVPKWLHGDLLRPNLLVAGGRLRAVLDFGGVGVGDPAMDAVPAWATFGPRGRAAYRAALGVDDGTWERGRGYALHQAALIIPYYAITNPGFTALAVRTVREVARDLQTGG